ncbi:MFS transporter [Actinoplanes sp. NPDC089786]|uniref:MFS transporter n=1 Tax=Actinoplanes sp. NPDC089786 TaxID=3155185 RepID=UPI00342BDE46
MLTRARVATSIMFAVHGSVTGTFAARLPWMADHVGVEVGGLGVALLMPGVGALLAMPLSGRLVHRYDLRTLTRLLMLCWCLALVPTALAGSLPLLCAALVLYGATAGVADVAMNAHAVVVEERLGRSVMSGFHGFWSLGGLAGSSVAALAAKFGVDGRVHFAAAAAVLCVIAAVGATGLLPHRPEPEVDEPPAFALPSRAVLPIGLVGLCAVFAEAAGLDWSALYVRNLLDGSASTAALTVAIFSVAMALTRFAGDAVVRRLGAALTVRIAAGCALAGAVVVVLARVPVVAIVGFGLVGVGIAVVVPLVFAAAGRLDDQPGRNIAGVAGIAYGSSLIAPGVLGGIAHLSSLTISFILVAILLAAMGAAAGALRARNA